MKKQQIILAGCAFILLAILYFLGDTIPHKKNTNSITKENISDRKPFNILQHIQKLKIQLSTLQLNAVEKLEKSINQPDALTKLNAYRTLAAFWKDSLHFFEPYAYYTVLAAKLENSEKSMTFAANLLLSDLPSEPNGPLKTWLANESKQLFEKVLFINPNNDSLSIGLGASFIYGATVDHPEEAMKGIQRILVVARKDSLNMYAQFMLGVGGLASGRYEKAINRFLTVLNHEPTNIEAMLSLAEAYELSGDKANAITWYSMGVKNITIPDVKKELETRINQLKSNQ